MRDRPGLGARTPFRLTLVLVLFLVGCGRSIPFVARPTLSPTSPQASTSPLSWEEVRTRLHPATILVRFTLPNGNPFAVTGAVYAPDRIVTVAPPLSEGPPSSVTVALPDQPETRPAHLLAISPCDGIAVLQIEDRTGLAAAPLGTSNPPDIGEDVLVIGYQSTDPPAIPLTVPAAIAGTVQDSRRELDQIAVNVNLSGLTIGSLLVNRFGAVLGLALPTGLFLPAERVRTAAEALGERGVLWLGVGLSPHRNPEWYGTGKGLVVLDVAPAGPAQAAGITPGMLIERVNDTEITSFAQLCRLLREHRQGDDLVLGLRAPEPDAVVLLQTRVRIGEPISGTPQRQQRQPRTTTSIAPLQRSWSFEEPNAGTDWPIGASQVGRGEISSGRYRITIAQPQAFGVFIPQTVGEATDQRIQAEVILPDEAGAGLVLRYSEEPGDLRNLYLCVVVRSAGQLAATCSAALLGEVAMLLPLTPLPTLELITDPLLLEFRAEGKRLIFTVNGQVVADLEDLLIGHGQAGLWVESFDTAPLTVEFESVEIIATPRPSTV